MADNLHTLPASSTVVGVVYSACSDSTTMQQSKTVNVTQSWVSNFKSLLMYSLINSSHWLCCTLPCWAAIITETNSQSTLPDTSLLAVPRSHISFLCYSHIWSCCETNLIRPVAKGGQSNRTPPPPGGKRSLFRWLFERRHIEYRPLWNRIYKIE